MNNGSYIGRMTKDFTLSNSGKMGTGTVAVDRPFPHGKDQDGNQITDFLTIKIIGEDKAKRAEQYLLKGTKIGFSGITCRDTTKDGDDWKEYNYILCTGWEFAESKNSGSKASSRPEPSSAGDGFYNVADSIDEELPFN